MIGWFVEASGAKRWLRPLSSSTYDLIGGRFFTGPLEPGDGALVCGPLRAVTTRTEAGCTFHPGEEEDYPQLLALELRGALAPLKRAPRDRAPLVEAAARWEDDPGYGGGPPYVRSQDPWLRPDDLRPDVRVAQQVIVRGFWYPVFNAGTYASFQIWGLYAEEVVPS